jgi:hypothetical protein
MFLFRQPKQKEKEKNIHAYVWSIYLDDAKNKCLAFTLLSK